MSIVRIIFLLSIFSFSFFGCTEETVTTPTENEVGALSIEFDNVVGDQQMQLDGPSIYTNSFGEKFNFSTFDYYISNIILSISDGKTYVVPQDSSYFLIRESQIASRIVTVRNIPAADYSSISFTIGVDSLRNTMDVAKRTGALDVSNGMYWSWNSGYIFLKAEGNSTASENGSFRYHIGGFGGMNSATINNVKSVTLPFGGSKATVRKAISPTVHVLVDALKLFNGPKPLNIGTNPTVMFDPFSVNIAQNYSTMFSVEHVHND